MRTMHLSSRRSTINYHHPSLSVFYPLALQVRRSPRRRAAPRPKMCKPHCIRPVEDVTEDEIQLVADNMTEKVYNRVTVSSQLGFYLQVSLH